MVGRSNIVGLPVSLLLLKADATVTIVHSHTQDPETFIREADIVIAAAGQAMMVKKKNSSFFCVCVCLMSLIVGNDASLPLSFPIDLSKMSNIAFFTLGMISMRK